MLRSIWFTSAPFLLQLLITPLMLLIRCQSLACTCPPSLIRCLNSLFYPVIHSPCCIQCVYFYKLYLEINIVCKYSCIYLFNWEVVLCWRGKYLIWHLLSSICFYLQSHKKFYWFLVRLIEICAWDWEKINNVVFLIKFQTSSQWGKLWAIILGKIEKALGSHFCWALWCWWSSCSTLIDIN